MNLRRFLSGLYSSISSRSTNRLLLLRSVRGERGDVIGDRAEVIFSLLSCSIFCRMLSTRSKRRLVAGELGADVEMLSTLIGSGFRLRVVVNELLLLSFDDVIVLSSARGDRRLRMAFSSRDDDF